MSESHPTPPESPAANPADRLRGRLMAASLGRLFDQVPGSRHALPHLAALEQALGQRGAAAIDAVPDRWRLRIAAQLAGLPLPEDDPALQDLRARLLGESDDGAARATPPAPTGRGAPSQATATATATATVATPSEPAATAPDVAPGEPVTLTWVPEPLPDTPPAPQPVAEAPFVDTMPLLELVLEPEDLPAPPAPPPAAQRPAPQSLSSLMRGTKDSADDDLVVRELSHSEFMAMTADTGLDANER